MTNISKDTLWKGIIEDLFEDFCHYFFPDWARTVPDFSQNPEFLDKELDEIYPENKAQKRYADKLIKVFTKQGQAQWLLIHIEVQGYQDTAFAQRMFTYFYRILDRYKQKIMSIAIFTDDNKHFKPQKFIYEYEKTKNTYEFDTFKILEKMEQELSIPNNPFSIVMLTARRALQKQNLADNQQLVWKKDLVLALRKANYSKDTIRQILNFIRYYVKFKEPDNLEELNQNIQETFKQRKNMGIEEAILHEVKEQTTQQNTIKGIKKALEQKVLNVNQIAELFEVTVDFVLKIQKEIAP